MITTEEYIDPKKKKKTTEEYYKSNIIGSTKFCLLNKLVLFFS